jgi:hypothetical protein
VGDATMFGRAVSIEIEIVTGLLPRTTISLLLLRGWIHVTRFTLRRNAARIAGPFARLRSGMEPRLEAL